MMPVTAQLSARDLRPFMVAALSFGAALALFWPGFAEYDSVLQYGQALAGSYDDWHPPVMARLWALLIGVVGPGAGPMLILQLGGYVFGLTLIAAASMRAGRPRAALAVAAIGWWPPFLGWQGVILKDAQGVAALLAAVGIVAWYRLAGRAVPGWARLIVAVILLYALLVRANAVFAVAPLVAGLAATRMLPRVAIAGGLIVLTLALSPLVNHRLLRASPSGVERTQPFYDLAGIAARVGATDTGFTATEAQTLRSHRCVTPFFWDRLGEAPGCGAATVRMWNLPAGRLYRHWLKAVIAHPLAFAAHRLAHLNSTDRWWVPARWPGAAPPAGSEPNELGLGQPRRLAYHWQRIAGWLVETPLGWPVVWIALAALTLAAGWRVAGPAAVLARALLVSALMLEASFAAISIASDLRYHLWAMIATGLALVLLGRAPWRRRWRTLLALVLAAVIGVGGVARAVLPSPPQDYAEWMA